MPERERPIFYCRTCGWARRHVTAEREPGIWLYKPGDAVASHRVDAPDHDVDFYLDGDGARAPIEAKKLMEVTPAEYALGRAYDLGHERGRARMRELVRDSINQLLENVR
jgi:hypothetical protein